MSRDSYKFNRDSSHTFVRSERVNWLDNFADQLASEKPKSAVEVARQRNQSIVDQINSVVQNKPTHATVDSAVKDMQKRIGLTEYLKRVSNENCSTKVAQEDIFAKYDVNDDVKEKIIDIIDHLLKTKPHIKLTNIEQEVEDNFKNQVGSDFLNSKPFKLLINKMIIEHNANNPAQEYDDKLSDKSDGQVSEDDDSANSDFFANLMPNTG
jgi:hypothetical protein